MALKTSPGENKMIRQGAYLLPNLLTSFSLLCGIVAMVLCLEYLAAKVKVRAENPFFYTSAAWLIIAAMFFDFLDGKVARWVHAESEFGVKIDSLADFVSFGIAPVVLAYTVLLPHVTQVVQWAACGSFLFAGAWRLARFNCEAGHCPQTTHFTGLPIPAAASFICSLILITPASEKGGTFFLGRSFSMLPPGVAGVLAALLLFLLAFLMMSRIPFPAFKKNNSRNFILFGGVAVFILVLMLVLPIPHIVFLIMVLYLVFGLFQYFLDRVLKLQKQADLQSHHE